MLAYLDPFPFPFHTPPNYIASFPAPSSGRVAFGDGNQDSDQHLQLEPWKRQISRTLNRV